MGSIAAIGDIDSKPAEMPKSLPSDEEFAALMAMCGTIARRQHKLAELKKKSRELDEELAALVESLDAQAAMIAAIRQASGGSLPD